MRFALVSAAAAVAILVIAGFHGPAFAEMQDRTGVVPHSRIPAPIISDAIVRLDVPHIRQQPGLCVPTSSAMILKYFGETYDPLKLKVLAEDQKPPAQRNTAFTYWADMRQALQRIGKSWTIREYVKADSGFAQGLSDFKRSLRAGNPVMIDVHLGAGHTFVVMGYNDRGKVAYIRDPNLPASESRVIAYDELLRSWHNHKFADSRSAFYSQR